MDLLVKGLQNLNFPNDEDPGQKLYTIAVRLRRYRATASLVFMSAFTLLLVPHGLVNVPFPAERMQRLETAVAQLNATDALVISTVAGMQGQFAEMQSRLSRVEAFVDMKPPAIPPLAPPPSSPAPLAPPPSVSATQLTNTDQRNPTSKTVVAAWKHRFSRPATPWPVWQVAEAFILEVSRGPYPF